ncbi:MULTISPECIES: hypothetical protein [Pontibacillus]|uniref:DUF4363 family protein n=1 Tax=Pontibacillus chungwhensis TaxID=265426 RepID=A0ABY8UW11_9BACI|nr:MULTISPECIES: hypothetical protein [Pontibacillus]MCD5325098.1 hypothetical protein [Pontibacillus sp. HN14]WIF97348.1 hypothetical protein QNI29_16675 [Pontibacillus chungwhensis]
MKRIYWIVPCLVLALNIVMTPVMNQASAEEEERGVSVSEGIDQVLAAIDTLQMAVQNNAKLSELNKAGKKLDEAWDVIEDQVEEKSPKDYKIIEESLYPLIGEAQKPSPDVNKIEQLIVETNEKLKSYQATLEQ